MSKTKDKRRKNSRRAYRQSRKEISEATKERRASLKELKLQRLAKQEVAVAEALKRPTGPRQQVLDALDTESKKRGQLFHGLCIGNALQRKIGLERDGQLDRLMLFVADKAPRLIDPTYAPALYWVSKLPWVRCLEDWQPRGKGRDTVFRSLAEHLLAKYPMPALLWNALFEASAEQLHTFVGFVAGGGSLYKAVQQDLLPVPLTRAMCHELMTLPAERFTSAVRRVLVKAHGGDLRLHQAWMATRVGEAIQTRAEEDFWITVLRWFAANPLLDRAQLGPLIDFIAFRRAGNPDFSMKGRSPLAMLRGMHTWHGDLAKEKAIKGITFQPSGFESKNYLNKVKLPTGGTHEETWKVTEIACSKELAAEGRALKHCVYSYAWRIEDGEVSIWSMTRDDERCLTIEVLNGSGRIVQARGKCNRRPTSDESRFLIRWAGDNALEVASNRLF